MKILHIASLGLALFVIGCTNTVSEGVQQDGSVARLVWPDANDSWRDTPAIIESKKLALVKVGMSRRDALKLLDAPHFSETHRAQEWNYRWRIDNGDAVCALKLIYDRNDIVRGIYWLPENCGVAK